MPQIINTFRGESPLGAMIANLGQNLWGDQAGAALTREQAYAAQRGNVEMDNLMARVAGEGGAQALGADPMAQAMLIGSGYAPEDFGYIGRMGAANEYGARDPRTINWQVGVGQPYNQTAEAFDLDLAETARANNMASADRRYGIDRNFELGMHEFENTPIEAIVNGVPVYVPRSGAFEEGVGPVLSETEAVALNLMEMFPNMTPEQQLTVVGGVPELVETIGDDGRTILTPQANAAGMETPVNIGTTWNYIMPDGTVYLTNDEMFARGLDAQGNPLPPGGTRGELTGGAGDLGLTSTTRGGIQAHEIALQRFNAVADQMQSLLDDPNSRWGVTGWVNSKAQEILQAFGEVVNIIRPEDAEAVRNFLPELYNENLPAQQTLGTLMVYLGAAALAGQENRSVSDYDIQRMRMAFPDPFGLFSSRNSVQAALNVVRSIVGDFNEINQNALNEGVGGAFNPAAQPEAQAEPAAPAPAAAPEANVPVAPAPQAETTATGWPMDQVRQLLTVENIRQTAEENNIQYAEAIRLVAEHFGITFDQAMAILQGE